VTTAQELDFILKDENRGLSAGNSSTELLFAVLSTRACVSSFLVVENDNFENLLLCQ
jgi:hypothetical protein